MAGQRIARATHAQRAANRRQAILKAATEEFLEKGYRATLRGIMDRSGGSRATFYKEFGSKAELFRTIGLKQAQDLINGLGSSWSEDGGIRQVLTRYAQAYAAVVLDPAIIRINKSGIIEAENIPGLTDIFFEAHIMGVVQPIAAYLRRLHGSGDLNIPDADLAAQLFIVMVKGNFQTMGMVDTSKLPGQAELNRHISLAVEIFVRGTTP